MAQDFSDSVHALRVAFGRDVARHVQNGARVVPIHDVVPGRIRLYVTGLKGTEGLRSQLESRLRRSGLIDRVSASTVTGTLLVTFPASRERVDVVAYIEQVLLQYASAPEIDDRGSGSLATSVAHPSVSEPWHSLPTNEVLSALDASRSGLTREIARERLRVFGRNTLPSATPRSSLAIFLGQFKSLPVALLGASAVLSVGTGGLVDALAIAAVVLINAVTGYLTESQSERTINALTRIARRRRALAMRDGVPLQVDADELVPGDTLVLAPGCRVHADARLIESRDLTVDESALTGESLPAPKRADGALAPNAPLADQFNMVRMGTGVTTGSGVAVVVATGLDTEIGRVQSLVSEARPPETPMQRQLNHLGRQLVWLSGGICAAVFGIGVLRQLGFLPMLRASVSLAVAAVPEGLPTVATTTLAMSIRAMRRHKVLVRQLDAIETLGAVQLMCMDKTGTLTLNRMSVLAVHTGMRRLDMRERGLMEGDALVEPAATSELQRLLRICVLCNETEVNGGHEELTLNGSATEAALLRFAMDMGVSYDEVRTRYPLATTEYRSHNRNYMRTVHEADDGARLVAVKGAPSEVLEMCRSYLRNGEVQALDEAERAAILAENDRMAQQALRILGFAYCRETDSAPVNGDLIWAGLIGLADPIRGGIVEVIEQFHRAGIRTAMVTGDQSATAHAIGKHLRLSGRNDLNIMDSTQLETLEPLAIGASAQSVDVFARVSPVHKLRIVEALQEAGCVVAMTGDGINDGPALRAADIGVAMGGAGTDLARSVADIILEDDNLQAMIIAISEGRTSYDNIRKAVHFLVSSNLSEIWLTLTSVAAGLGAPLTPMQLLWINLITDIFPALALAVEPPEPDVLRRPPRDPTEPIIGRADFARFALESGVLTSASLAAYGYGRLRYGPGPHAGTIAFMSLGLAQLAHTYSCRSDRHGLFTSELARNRWLDIAVGGSSVAQMLTVIAPALRSLLGTAPLRIADFAVSALAATGPYLVNEGLKASRTRRGEREGSTRERPRQRIAPINAAADR